jgi:hypothetical protein
MSQLRLKKCPVVKLGKTRCQQFDIAAACQLNSFDKVVNHLRKLYVFLRRAFFLCLMHGIPWLLRYP